MNEQSFFNSQSNSNNVNSNNGPMKPVKNRFFNQELFADTNFEEVGSSTSNQVNNQVISWGVGGNRTNVENKSSSQKQVNSLFSQELLEDVNGTVYTASEPEVLDDFMMNDTPNTVQQNNAQPISTPVQNETLFGYTNNSDNNVNNVAPVQNQVTNIPNNIPNNVAGLNSDLEVNTSQTNEVLSNDVLSNQPLMGALNENSSNSVGVPVVGANVNNVQPSIINQPIVNQPPIGNQQAMMNNNIGMNQQPMINSQPVINNTSVPNYNNQVSPNVVNSVPVGAQAPLFDQNTSVSPVPHGPMIDNSLLAQQPLSANSLGASEIYTQNVVEDNVDNAKYFPVQNNNVQTNNVVVEPTVVNNAPPLSMVDEDVIVIDEKAMMKAYVGKNFDNINKSNFSVSALFMASFVYFYRGLYVIGLLIFALQAFALYVLRDNLLVLAAVIIVVSIVLALITNPLYLAIVKHRVSDIKKRYPKISQGDINNICAKKGQNSPLLAIVLQVGLLAASVFLALQLLGEDYFIDLYENARDAIIKPKEIEYDGNLFYEDVDVKAFFDIELPEGFTKENALWYKYSFTTLGEGKKNKCTIDFGEVKEFKNAKDLLQKIAVYNKEDKDIVEKVENGDNTWYVLSLETKSGNMYYRAIELEGKLFVLQYLNGKDTTEGVCDSHLVNILGTIQIK